MSEEKVKEVPEVKKPEEVKNRYEQVEVVTETGLAVKDNKTEKILTGDNLLIELLNKIDKIEKAIV